MPFDTGFTRSLSVVTAKNRNYIGVIHFISFTSSTSGGGLSQGALERFEKSLSDEEGEVLEEVSKVNARGFAAGVKCAFFLFYIKNKGRKREIMDLFYATHTQNFDNPKANELKAYIQDAKRAKFSGGKESQVRDFVFVLGMLNDLTKRKYTSDAYRLECLRLLSDWGKHRF